MNHRRKSSLAIVGFVAVLFAGSVEARTLEGTRYGDAAFAHLFETPPPPPPSLPPSIVWQDPAQPHPAPKHTGFQALIRGIGSDFKAFPLRKSTYVILAVGGAAAALAFVLLRRR